MPVAAFPATVETLLTSLLSTNSLSTWKIAGEPENVVVVLRFRQDGQQPFLRHEQERGQWKRKTPSQIKRDRQRTERHRNIGEQQKAELDSFPLNLTKSDLVSNSHSSGVECAREAHGKPCSTSAVTFDPQGAQHDLEVCQQSAVDPTPLQKNSSDDTHGGFPESSVCGGDHPNEAGGMRGNVEGLWMRR